jgi:hypothetical protein
MPVSVSENRLQAQRQIWLLFSYSVALHCITYASCMAARSGLFGLPMRLLRKDFFA